MGLGSSIRRAAGRLSNFASSNTSRLGNEIRDNSRRFEGEYRRWGRAADPYWKWAAYGMYAGQFNIGTREAAKKSGYSKEEAASLGDRLGTNFQSVSMDRTMRLAEEATNKSEQAFAAVAERERDKARRQVAVRIRRGTPGRSGMSTGSYATNGLGTTGGSNVGATFASMLGL